MVIKTPERELADLRALSDEELMKISDRARARDAEREEAAERIERLQQTLREREWRPIETAHKTNRAILVWCRGYKNTYVVTWHNDYNNWVVFGGYELSETPTHWMPLPEPPQ